MVVAAASFIALEVIMYYAKKKAAKEVELEFEREQRERFMHQERNTTEPNTTRHGTAL